MTMSTLPEDGRTFYFREFQAPADVTRVAVPAADGTFETYVFYRRWVNPAGRRFEARPWAEADGLPNRWVPEDNPYEPSASWYLLLKNAKGNGGVRELPDTVGPRTWVDDAPGSDEEALRLLDLAIAHVRDYWDVLDAPTSEEDEVVSRFPYRDEAWVRQALANPKR